MTQLEKPPTVEYWKEQFGFVSGTVLVSGFVFLKIWPYAAMFQMGMPPPAWTGTPAPPENWFFSVLTLILALGMSSVLFSLVCVVYRGLSIGMLPYSRRSSLIQSFQNRLQTGANRLYLSVLFVWLLIAYCVLLMMFC
jgi:CDP-diglyceride synthetase